MTKNCILLALPLLAACSGADQDRLSNKVENHPARHDPLNPPPPIQPGGPAPVSENPADPRSPQAAAAVLRRYFALVDAGRWDEAEALWWDDNRAEDFAARLRRLGEFEPNIAAPQRPEGAAGSVYVSISLQLLRDSRSLSDGTAVLRRVNDVPGSTEEQRRWRIDRITLQPPPEPAPAPASYRFVGSWASNERNCEGQAWRFTANRLTTPAGSVCEFRDIREVPGGYDIAARCTAESPPTDDTLELRFAESARALLFESDVIADAGLVRCS